MRRISLHLFDFRSLLAPSIVRVGLLALLGVRLREGFLVDSIQPPVEERGGTSNEKTFVAFLWLRPQSIAARRRCPTIGR